MYKRVCMLSTHVVYICMKIVGGTWLSMCVHIDGEIAAGWSVKETGGAWGQANTIQTSIHYCILSQVCDSHGILVG